MNSPWGARAIAGAILLCAAAAHAERPQSAEVVLGRHVSAGAGALGNGATFFDGRWGDFAITQQVEARWLFGPLTLEGGVLNATPVVANSSVGAVTGTLRAGYTGERFSVTAGLNAQYAPAATEGRTQLLPTVKATYAFQPLAITAAVFDVHALMLARVSVDVDRWGVGYVAPLGAEVHARFPISNGFGIGVQAFAVKIASAEMAFVSLSGTWEPTSSSGGEP